MGYYTEVGESNIEVSAVIPADMVRGLWEENWFAIRAVPGVAHLFTIEPMDTGRPDFSGGNDDLARELVALIERIKTAFPEATFSGYAELESSEGWHSMIEVTPDGNIWLRDGGEITYSETRERISAEKS
jgi:hypothetical protein